MGRLAKEDAEPVIRLSDRDLQRRDRGAGLFHERPELFHVEDVCGAHLLLACSDRHEPLLEPQVVRAILIRCCPTRYCT